MRYLLPIVIVGLAACILVVNPSQPEARHSERQGDEASYWMADYNEMLMTMMNSGADMTSEERQEL
jgi:hypothetical protein